MFMATDRACRNFQLQTTALNSYLAVVLVMRIYALFAGSKRMLVALVIPFVLLIIVASMELIWYSVEVKGAE